MKANFDLIRLYAEYYSLYKTMKEAESQKEIWAAKEKHYRLNLEDTRRLIEEKEKVI